MGHSPSPHSSGMTGTGLGSQTSQARAQRWKLGWPRRGGWGAEPSLGTAGLRASGWGGPHSSDPPQVAGPPISCRTYGVHMVWGTPGHVSLGGGLEGVCTPWSGRVPALGALPLPCMALSAPRLVGRAWWRPPGIQGLAPLLPPVAAHPDCGGWGTPDLFPPDSPQEPQAGHDLCPRNPFI